MKKTVISACICIVLFPALAAGQCVSSQAKPSWTDGYFLEKKNSYIEVASATGYTEEEARNRAAAVIVERRSGATGQRVTVQVRGNNVMVSGNDHLTVKSRVIDEYRELCDGQHRVYILVQTAKNPTFEFEPVKVTSDYGFLPGAFLPGMAQLQKGSKVKGILFIAGEITLVGGVVVAESLRASCTSKINDTHSADSRQTYIDDANNWESMRNVFIAGAAALYVWNVIDGIAAKGRKHVVMLGDNRLDIMPFATPHAGGISLALHF
ncbi:MAG: hypothetical protein LBJ23_04945 [Tannerella sp.]|jgi:hypothetical protein|nr:hypothetical protein [Tannerella sp.]